MVVFLRRNGLLWSAPGADDAVTTMVAVASKELETSDLAAWIRIHIA
jgi:prophage maintenance system killer protein